MQRADPWVGSSAQYKTRKRNKQDLFASCKVGTRPDIDVGLGKEEYVMRYVIVLLAALLLPVLMPVSVQAKQILKGPFPFELLEVIDGDTFRARVTIWLGQTVDVKVRLKGVDTPEMNGKCAAEKELARAAKKFAADWLAAHPAQLIRVHYGTYAGRVLATTMDADGATLAAALLSEKLAKPYRGRKAKWCA